LKDLCNTHQKYFKVNNLRKILSRNFQVKH